jgi:hypothetical protein
MPELTSSFKQLFSNLITKTIPAIVLSLVLFFGGVWLLALRIPGWSLFLGLPAVQIGIIFLIFTFDEVMRGKVGSDSLQMLSCSVCGKPTLAPAWQKEKICGECKRKRAKKTRTEGD